MTARLVTLLTIVPLVMGAGESERDPAAAVEAVARAVQHGIVDRSPEKLAHFVGSDGIDCNDDMTPRDDVLKELRTKRIWLNSYLFDSPYFRERYVSPAYPMSLAEFFATHPSPSLRVDFIEVDGRKRLDWACVSFSANGEKFHPRLCFFKAPEGWIFTQSPIPCA